MKVLYKVGGTLSKDFIGQISYTVCLDRKYEELDIEFFLLISKSTQPRM